MKTCVSMNCPFISYCKDYSLTADRGDRCITQERIVRAAKSLESRINKYAKNKGGQTG